MADERQPLPPMHIFAFTMTVTPHGIASAYQVMMNGKLVKADTGTFPDPFQGFEWIATQAKGMSASFGSFLQDQNRKN